MAAGSRRKIIPVADPAALAKMAADRLSARISTNSGRIAICLTGGSSPTQLYALLAAEAYRSKITWESVDWFMGDEGLVAVRDTRKDMGGVLKYFLDLCADSRHI